MWRFVRLTVLLLLVVLPIQVARGEEDPGTPEGRLALARKLGGQVLALLRQTPPDLDAAEDLAARALDLRKRAAKQGGRELAIGFLLLARVHERRAADRPRLDHLDPALDLARQAIETLEASEKGDLRVLAEAHTIRGRVLRTAWRTTDAWQAHAEAARLLAAPPLDHADALATVLAAALEAFDYSGVTAAAQAARHALAEPARRLVDAVAADPERRPQAEFLLGGCLAGELAHRAAAAEVLERAVKGFDAGDARHVRSATRAQLRLAWHHWHCGDMQASHAAFQKAASRLAKAGRTLEPRAHASALDQWATAAELWFRRVMEGPASKLVMRDDLATRLPAEGRVAEAWWAVRGVSNAYFFRAAATAASAKARGAGGVALMRALRFEAVVVASAHGLDEASARFAEALAAAPAGGRHAAERAGVLWDLGICEHLRGHAGDAVRHLREAARLLESLHGLVHAHTLEALALHAVALIRAGEIREAHALADRLLEQLRTNDALNTWLDERANVQTAGRLARGCWILCQGLGRLQDLDALRIRFPARFLGSLLSPLEQLRAAGRYRETVERLRHPTQDLIEPDAPGGSLSFNEVPRFPVMLSALRLSEALLDIGSYEEAYAASLDAGDELTAIRPDRYLHPQFLYADLRASTLLASILLERGLSDEALATARRAHRLQTLIPGWLRQHPTELNGVWMAPDTRVSPVWRFTEERVWYALSMARASEVLARALEAVGEPDEALAAFTEAVATVRERCGPKHPRIAELLHARAAVAFRLGRRSEARRDSKAAGAIAIAAYGDTHPAVAEIWLTLGDLDLAEGDTKSALIHYLAVRSIADAKLHVTHMHGIRARSGVALCAVKEGRAAEGVEPMQAALERVVQRVRDAGPGATAPQRLALLATTHWVVANWLEVTRAARLDGYDALLQARGLAGRLRGDDERAFRQGGAKAAETHEALRAEQRRLARLVRLGRLFGRGKAGHWQRLVWRRQVAESRAACADLSKRLAKESRAFARTIKAKPTNARRLAKALKGSEALVDIVEAGGRYTAWVLTRGEVPRRVELGASEVLDEAAYALVAEMHHDTPADTLAKAAANTRAACWDTLAAALPAEVTTLYIVPGGCFATMPLGFLPGKAAGTHLIDDYLLVHLTSADALLPRALPTRVGRGFVTVGDVDFNRAEREGDTGAVVTGRRLSGLKHGFRPVGLLEATREEALGVGKALKAARRVGTPGVHLTGATATEGRLRDAVSGKAVIHLATHAVVRSGGSSKLAVPQGDMYRLQPGLELYAHRLDPLLMSGVMLAGVNARVTEGDDDGMLTALEALQLDLDAAQLVVLSACESARGIEQSVEGTSGLVQALRIAGARSVVGTLWRVMDTPTAAFMERFYAVWTKRKSVTAAEALRETMRVMRDGDLGDANRHPAHWSAFVAYGPLR